ncbi:hypothetical protein [Bacillus sp. 1735sda2]|uniref:hypothetical protein n=1 Tax=Bacillus sp. 1735sda2 TaxID=2953806 RepID=UPI00209F49FA|nr:hypothetical protein [Bacillus sp. 1735sda2]MCP1147391.1 hypothetical protein [Bacillus sp. 1735sda2]
MSQFNFIKLIDKYSVTFDLIVQSAGDYDDLGRWQDSESITTTQKGALVVLPSQLIYQSGGRLTTFDRQLYISKSVEIPLKSKVIYKESSYHVESMNPFEDYADFNSYILKAVSSFD